MFPAFIRRAGTVIGIMDRHPTTEPFYNRVRSDLASSERLTEQLRGEIFDLKLVVEAQSADLKKLRGCAAERDEYAEELLKTEEELQQQAPRLERAEMRVAILEAEVETVHKQLEEMNRTRLQISLSRQHEGFRIVGNMLSTAQLGRLMAGFWRWRATVVDIGAWRLELARRAAGSPQPRGGSGVRGCGDDPPTRRSPCPFARRALASMTPVGVREKSTCDTGTQTMDDCVDRSLSGQYAALMREAKAHAQVAARKAAHTPADQDDEALARRLANSLSASERPAPLGSPEAVVDEPQLPQRLHQEDEGFGRDIASIQHAVRGVLSSRESKARHNECTSRRAEQDPRKGATAKADEVQAIRRLLVTRAGDRDARPD